MGVKQQGEIRQLFYEFRHAEKVEDSLVAGGEPYSQHAQGKPANLAGGRGSGRDGAETGH
jgi:hypothetical protein